MNLFYSHYIICVIFSQGISLLGEIKKAIRQVFNYEKWLTFCALMYRKSGVDKSVRENTYVISLTSIPSRIHKVHIVIESLLTQSYKPASLVLWLSEYNREGIKVLDRDNLPLILKRQMKRGLDVYFCDDIRSYRKLLPSIERFPESHIVTADDDIIYPKDWLEKLVKVHSSNPNFIICYRGVEITLNKERTALKPYLEWPEYTQKNEPSSYLFPQGGEGTIYPKGAFNKELFNQSVFLNVCLTADDVWFKSMSLFNDIKCVKITEKHQDFLRVRDSQGDNTLHFVNNIQGQNDVQINEVFEKYNLIACLKSKSL